MTDHSPPDDNPVEVIGYKTDPLRRGYQILWNYESTYWRALVGRDAWSLYEVLRSFCHTKNNTCRPSITLLTAILGMKDKRAIIGRPTALKVGEKSYKYLGLIEFLQQHKLVIAEVKGKDRTARYVFHVNQTPPLLTEDQLQKLPAILQKKHRELLQRCEADLKELEQKKRPPKIEPVKKGAAQPHKGVEIFHTPMENFHTNITHITLPTNTTVTETGGSNNNTDGIPKDKKDLLLLLTEKNIAKKTARSLCARYSRGRIEDHLELVDWLQKNREGYIKTSITGFLIKAIRENYLQTNEYPGFKTTRQRLAEEQERERKRKERERELAAQMAEKASELENQRQILEQQKLAKEQQMKPTEELKNSWSASISHVGATQSAIVRTVLERNIDILGADNNHLVIWLDQPFLQNQVDKVMPAIYRLMAKHLNAPYEDLTHEFIYPNGESGAPPP